MITKAAPALYRGSGTGEDETAACPAQGLADAMAQQVRRQRAAIVSSFFSGASLMTAGLFVVAAYATEKDAVPPLVIGSFTGLAGALFGAYAVGVSGRLLSYLRGLGHKVLRLEAIIIDLRLRASLKDAQRAGESEDGRWNEGCSSSDVIPFNKRH